MGIFDNLTNAQVFERSAYFEPGLYIVQINAVKYIDSGYKGDAFVIEAKVLASKKTKENEPLAPGATAAQVWRASGDKKEIARGTWIGFLCAVFGIKQVDWDDARWKKVSADVIDNNALKGTELGLEVFTTTTKAGGDFTQHRWLGQPTDALRAELAA